MNLYRMIFSAADPLEPDVLRHGLYPDRAVGLHDRGAQTKLTVRGGAEGVGLPARCHSHCVVPATRHARHLLGQGIFIMCYPSLNGIMVEG